YSDIRLKTNIEDLVDAMAIVNALQGKRYTWKQGTPMHDSTGGKQVIGLIGNVSLIAPIHHVLTSPLLAQEVYRVLPEVVHQDPDGMLSIDYAELVPVLITAFNEHLKNES